MSSSTRDPYEVLGVGKDADADALKSAYRQKAMQYHPDRNPGDRVAEERFKELSEAYAVLRDPESRARYDRYGAQQAPDYRHDTSNVDWRDVFREADIHVDFSRGGVPNTGNAVFDALFGMMAGMLRGAGLVAGQTYELTLGLSLGELSAGATKVVAVPGPCMCPTCKGTGRVTGGAGRSLGPFEAGAQPSTVSVCPDCGGRGVKRGGARLQVKVPPHAHVGSKLRLAAAGGPGNPPGDVLVDLAWAAPAGARADGLDVVGRLVITPGEAANGTVAEFDGVSVKVPAGTASGATLLVKGKGLPGHGGAAGDLRLVVETAWLEGAARAVGRWLRKLGLGGETR